MNLEDNDPTDRQELYHEIFGSILDRKEMTPYLLRNCDGYDSAMRKATQMMANRGFDVIRGELGAGEKKRASAYVRQAIDYLGGWLFPFVKDQLQALETMASPQRGLYQEALDAIAEIQNELEREEFETLIEDDPRHLFMLASSAKYPNLFRGYRGGILRVPPRWRLLGCSVLKMCHLIKSIEEDSQDINDYAQLGLYLESRGHGLSDLFAFNWDDPALIPEDEPARRAFVKLAAFFRKLKESISFDERKDCLIFDSGDGVRVDIVEVKARLKSPESMFAKLGKDAEEEAHSIRDILALTFLLREREDSLTLFHALQKRGVILQEYTSSTSITQTLFENDVEMEEAVRRLMVNLTKSEGSETLPSATEVRANAHLFFKALNAYTDKNPYSADKHRKIQCKINYSIPVHRDTATRRILIPGTDTYAARDELSITTQQHSLPVELRISDCHSWEESEQVGDAHHDAYKCRQLLALMNRLFDPLFTFPVEAFPQLRVDQTQLFR